MYLNKLDTTGTIEDIGLTLTWDVFKLMELEHLEHMIQGLTLTWDVFKFPFAIFLISFANCLTLTWDVFKYGLLWHI